MAIKSKTPMYEQVANQLKDLINSAVYKPGECLPSIRNMAKSRNLSITTVMRAYQELEKLALVVVLPQSGYYVAYQNKPLTEPLILAPKNLNIDYIDLDRMVAENPKNSSLLYFGVGRAAPELVPAKQLNTILSRLIHTHNLLKNVQQPVEGHEDLRKQIIKLMYLRHSYISSKEVIISTSCTSSIYLSLSAICKPNDLIAIESPCNYGILRVFQSLGLRTVEVPANIKGGIDVEKLSEIIGQFEVKAIYVNPNCNNPTGSTMPTEEKEKLAKLVNERKIPLIEDDATGELYFGEQRPISIKAFDTNGYVLYCSSFSKIFPVTFQIGWVIAGKYTEEIIQMKRTSNSQVSMLIQMTAAEYLQSNSYQSHLRKIRRAYKQKVNRILNDIQIFFPYCPYISNPQGGYHIWVKLPENLDSTSVYRELLKNDLSVMPGQVFSADDYYADYIRLTASMYDENSRHYLQKIGEIIKQIIEK